jgi:hypothetical protein
MVAICAPLRPATREEILHRLALYEKDLKSCQEDLRKRYKNGNPPGMPNANRILHEECRRRIAHYEPAIKELKWVLGVE